MPGYPVADTATVKIMILRGEKFLWQSIFLESIIVAKNIRLPIGIKFCFLQLLKSIFCQNFYAQKDDAKYDDFVIVCFLKRLYFNLYIYASLFLTTDYA